MESQTRNSMENNNNMDKGPTSGDSLRTNSTGFVPLIPPQADYENTNSRVVELDDDGNELGELPRLPSKVSSRYISTLPRDLERADSLVPASPGILEEQICLSPGEPEDELDGYLAPQHHIYEEIKEVKKTVHITPTGSQILTIEEKTTRIPRRLKSIMGRSSSGGSDKDSIKCSCNKKMLFVIIVLLFLLVVTGVILVVVFVIQKPEQSDVQVAEARRAGDIIPPTLSCPRSQTVTLSDYSKTVQLGGAYARDNLGEPRVEYIPQLVDQSAVYEAPNTLILSQESGNRNYTVLVKARDTDDNEAECTYHVAVKDDPCVPWKLPEVESASKEIEKTVDGWKVTFACTSDSSSDGSLPPLSYHYLENAATFSCSAGTEFMPKKLFSCQVPSPALYSYVTTLVYQFLDHDNTTKLQNITESKARACFEDFYKDELVTNQMRLSEKLEEDIKNAAKRNRIDLSAMELSPSEVDHPHILKFKRNSAIVEAMNVTLGYTVGPPGQAFTANILNVFVYGTLRSEHNTLLSSEMEPFSRLKQGNSASGCPDVTAPVFSSIFNEISSGFNCNEGEKKYEYLNSAVTVCLGCPVGEFYNRDSGSCEECALNTYQDVVGAMECKLCPLNRKTEKTGARTIDDCVPL